MSLHILYLSPSFLLNCHSFLTWVANELFTKAELIKDDCSLSVSIIQPTLPSHLSLTPTLHLPYKGLAETRLCFSVVNFKVTHKYDGTVTHHQTLGWGWEGVCVCCGGSMHPCAWIHKLRQSTGFSHFANFRLIQSLENIDDSLFSRCILHLQRNCDLFEFFSISFHKFKYFLEEFFWLYNFNPENLMP